MIISDLDEYVSVSDQLTSIPLNQSRFIENKSAAVGMTIMKNELFVVYERCSVIESYSCVNYDYAGYKEIEKMNNPEDIASCPSEQCLYILNTNAEKSKLEILQIDAKTSSSIGAKWKVKGSHGRISVRNGVIVVSLLHEKVGHVIKYNPDLSSFYRFRMPISDSAFESPLRVLKSNDDQFLCLEEYATEVNLFLVDSKGIVLKKTPIANADMFAKHFHLITDTKGNAIFADMDERQICSYDSNLENKRELISTPRINTPDLIALDECDERLFVLSRDVKLVQIFPITRQKS